MLSLLFIPAALWLLVLAARDEERRRVREDAELLEEHGRMVRRRRARGRGRG